MKALPANVKPLKGVRFTRTAVDRAVQAEFQPIELVNCLRDPESVVYDRRFGRTVLSHGRVRMSTVEDDRSMVVVTVMSRGRAA